MITDQTNPDASQVIIDIAKRDMRSPNIMLLSPAASNFTLFQAITIANNIVIRDGVYWVFRLTFFMYFPQKIDITIGTGTMMNNDILPPLWPIDSTS